MKQQQQRNKIISNKRWRKNKQNTLSTKRKQKKKIANRGENKIIRKKSVFLPPKHTFIYFQRVLSSLSPMPGPSSHTASNTHPIKHIRPIIINYLCLMPVCLPTHASLPSDFILNFRIVYRHSAIYIYSGWLEAIALVSHSGTRNEKRIAALWMAHEWESTVKESISNLCARDSKMKILYETKK